jgi:hypothetical protein
VSCSVVVNILAVVHYQYLDGVGKALPVPLKSWKIALVGPFVAAAVVGPATWIIAVGTFAVAAAADLGVEEEDGVASVVCVVDVDAAAAVDEDAVVAVDDDAVVVAAVDDDVVAADAAAAVVGDEDVVAASFSSEPFGVAVVD